MGERMLASLAMLMVAAVADGLVLTTLLLVNDD